MTSPSSLYTVIGVVDGQFSVRVHDRMRAASPQAAVAIVEAGIARRFAVTSPGSRGLIGTTAPIHMPV